MPITFEILDQEATHTKSAWLDPQIGIFRSSCSQTPKVQLVRASIVADQYLLAPTLSIPHPSFHKRPDPLIWFLLTWCWPNVSYIAQVVLTEGALTLSKGGRREINQYQVQPLPAPSLTLYILLTLLLVLGFRL